LNGKQEIKKKNTTARKACGISRKRYKEISWQDYRIAKVIQPKHEA
jgi:hypothetical protein